MGGNAGVTKTIEQSFTPPPANPNPEGPPNPATPPSANPPANPNPDTPPATPNPVAPGTPPANPEAAVIPAPEFIETALGKIPINKNAPAPNPEPVKVETFDQAFASPQVVGIFGMPIATPQEFIDKALPVVQKWRTDSAAAGEVKTKLENLTQSFASLDPDLKTVVTAAIEGREKGDDSWKEMLNLKPSVNFKEPVEKVAESLLLDTYYPGKFTPEQIADKENETVQVALDASRKQYTTDKEKRDGAIAQKIEKAQQHKTAVSASLQSAVDAINEQLPVAMDPGRVSLVKEQMQNGQWLSLFFNADGTWKPEAAANIALAAHGKETFGTLISVVTNQATSKANEEIVDRGAVNRTQGNGAAQNPQQVIQKENANALAGLMLGQQPFFK
jgi:hypothetical protein